MLITIVMLTEETMKRQYRYVSPNVFLQTIKVNKRGNDERPRVIRIPTIIKILITRNAK